MKTRLLLFSMVILLANQLEAKGLSGYYWVEGTAYDSKGGLIQEDTIFLAMRADTIPVVTDDQGHYRVKVKYRTSCPSAVPYDQRKQVNEAMNPPLLFLYKGQQVEAKNEWRKYLRLLGQKSVDQAIEVDLKFL